MSQLSVHGINQAHRQVAPVLHMLKQDPVIDFARDYRCRGGSRVCIAFMVDRLKSYKQIVWAAQADDLLPAV